MIFEGKRVLVTGAAGFIGSHLVDRLLLEKAVVTGLDNFITGRKENLAAAFTSPNFHFMEADVVEWSKDAWNQKLDNSYDYIFHLASPASPKAYQHNPVATYMVNSLGTHQLLELAVEMRAQFLFTSTSEIYGNPLEHPQKETYFGNVNPIGPRACYDESKRFGEMVCKTFMDRYGVNTRIVRIFNTYGPRMQAQDGRIIPSFITQALDNKPITVEGPGTQTRSYCYVSDLVEYLMRAMLTEKAKNEVINIGNPEEISVSELAQMVKQLARSNSAIVNIEGRPEDITRRKPDISKALKLLEYEPNTNLERGLKETILYFREWARE